jgi:hypothetical protein
MFHQQAPLTDDAVMSFAAWCALNDISQPTGRRLIKRGDGPEIIRLSPKRIGITVKADREWKAKRVQRVA